VKNSTPLAENISELTEIMKKYIAARMDLIKVTLLEKVTRSGTYFFSFTVIIFIVFAVLLLLTFAFSFWYGENVGEIYGGFLIAAGFYLILGIILYLLRGPIFSNNIIKNLASIIFAENEEEEKTT